MHLVLLHVPAREVVHLPRAVTLHLELRRVERPLLPDEDVEEAAKRANVHNTIARLPEGYKTTVGERGLMISGGEKQRLAVARVLLKDPPILFFDEAVSRLSCMNRILF